MGSSYGCQGGPAHRAIVDWLRFDLPAQMRGAGHNVYTLPEVMYHHQASGGDDPDMALVIGDSTILFEVGNSQMGKWPECATIHVGFDGRVSVVNPELCAYTYEVRDIVSECLYETYNGVEGTQDGS